MADVLVLVLIAAFFGACIALVRGCDRIIGDDEPEDLDELDVPEEPARELGEPARDTAGAAR